MSLPRGVDTKRTYIGPTGKSSVTYVGNRDLTGGRERVEARDGGRVVDDALESFGQPEKLSKPAQRNRFEFGCGRRGSP